MPSKTFQPLLFDSFKYKLPNSTYADHYTFKKRTNSATINSKKLTQREKMNLLMKRSRPFTTSSVYKQTKNPSREEKVVYEKKQSVNFDPYVSVKEISPNGDSPLEKVSSCASPDLNIEQNRSKLISPPLSAKSIKVDELSNLVDATLKIEEVSLKKLEKIADLNDHWFVYKQEDMPNYIVEAKKRLGQIKEPFTIPNRAGNSSRISSKEEKSDENEANQFKLQSDSKSSFGSISTIKSKNEKHWLTWDNPSTPPHVKSIRGRLGDTRYKNSADLSYVRFKTLDEYNDHQSVLNVERPRTCTNAPTRPAFDLTSDSNVRPRVKTATITRIVPAPNEHQLDQIHLAQESTNEISNNNLLNNEGSLLFNDSQIEGLSNEPPTTTVETHVELVDSHAAQGSPSNENIIVLHNNHTNSVILSNQEKLLQRENTYNKFFKNHYTIEDNSNPVSLESWISNANEQDKNSIIRILANLEDSRSSLGSRMDTNMKLSKTSIHSKSNKKRPLTPQVRKLGTIRNSYKFPDEQEEKQLLKYHLWGEKVPAANVHYGYNF